MKNLEILITWTVKLKSDVQELLIDEIYGVLPYTMMHVKHREKIVAVGP